MDMDASRPLIQPLRFSLYGIGLSPFSVCLEFYGWESGWGGIQGKKGPRQKLLCILSCLWKRGLKCSTRDGRACEISWRWVECLGMCDDDAVRMDLGTGAAVRGWAIWKLIWIGPEQCVSLLGGKVKQNFN